MYGFDRRFFSPNFFSHNAKKHAMKTYSIIRFYRNRPNKTIRRGLTLREAQEWCDDPETSGNGWFDGYTEE